MNSSRPYLIRALHEWITDNGLTPHIVVDARVEGTRVPRSCGSDGEVVFNVAQQAVRGLILGNHDVVFDARFSGVNEHVVAPISSILAVYARENGQGMMFPREDLPSGAATETAAEIDSVDRSHLKVVK